MGILRDRLALLHPDHSITILPPEANMEWARREAIGLDENQDDQTKWTRIARVELRLVEEVETPSALPTARIAKRDSCRAG